DCQNLGKCHGQCHRDRYFGDISIVPGGFERGPSSLYRTVPQALKKSGAAIVYGHGVFTTGMEDFNEAFNRMLTIEKECLEEYYRRVNN
ncbi:MAG: class II aldolase/adducin family protein, partial [Syntrophales bacterium]|nr:class II aldolase/adducin family protein [Syntrophales bacterium]